jgi:ADP-ribosylglycohydrolase
MHSRAEGCLLGQLAGDSLGSLVEFKSPEEILARSLAEAGEYDAGNTVRAGLRGRPNTESQANGALMRVSPLGIFGANYPLEQVAGWAREDAAITHPHPVCLDANAIYAAAIADAVRTGPSPAELYARIVGRAEEWKVCEPVMRTLVAAAKEPPRDYIGERQGWVLVAFGNALWQLLHAETLEEGIVDTVMRGGDTDTNAAIAGALLGAVYGREAIPERWIESVLACRPAAGDPRVLHPRPERYWPADALDLASGLVTSPTAGNARGASAC